MTDFCEISNKISKKIFKKSKLCDEHLFFSSFLDYGILFSNVNTVFLFCSVFWLYYKFRKCVGDRV